MWADGVGEQSVVFRKQSLPTSAWCSLLSSSASGPERGSAKEGASLTDSSASVISG